MRQRLLSEGKTGKYLKYAVGEIVLVVIGILIALWINNINQDYQQNKEQQKLVISLEIELNENLKEFDSHKDYLNNCRLYYNKVLNFSAGGDTIVSVDSLRSYTSKMIPFNTININTSVLNNYKEFGNFNLIDKKLTELFTIYETALDNYSKVIEGFGPSYNKENNEMFLNFSSLNAFEYILHPDHPVAKHPSFKKSDSEFISYLKTEEVYELVYRANGQNAINIAWIETLERSVNNILNQIVKSRQ